MENSFLIDSDKLSAAALKRKHEIENNKSVRTNHMEFLPNMDKLDNDIYDKLVAASTGVDWDSYTKDDVLRALRSETLTIDDFKALLSPAAKPYIEEMAKRAKIETSKHFGNTVYLFTPLYIANYCDNYCVYCGFNCYNDIKRKR